MRVRLTHDIRVLNLIKIEEEKRLKYFLTLHRILVEIVLDEVMPEKPFKMPKINGLGEVCEVR